MDNSLLAVRGINHIYIVVGCRYSECVINYICNIAKKCGYENAYIATEHMGKVYEKYGFSYMENMVDVFGMINQVYYKKL